MVDEYLSFFKESRRLHHSTIIGGMYGLWSYVYSTGTTPDGLGFQIGAKIFWKDFWKCGLYRSTMQHFNFNYFYYTKTHIEHTSNKFTLLAPGTSWHAYTLHITHYGGSGALNLLSKYRIILKSTSILSPNTCTLLLLVYIILVRTGRKGTTD